MPEQASALAVRDLDVNSDTLWQELFDILTASEQSCIQRELGDELLESVLGQRVDIEGPAEQWQVLVFGCLAPETAGEILFSVFVSEMEDEGLTPTEEAEGCLRKLLADTDVAGIAAGTLPDASPDSARAVMAFAFGLAACFPDQFSMSSPELDAVPAEADASPLWRYSTGGWVVNSPAVADGVVYAGSDDNNMYALDASTGALLWIFETKDVIRSSPTVTGSGVYFGSNDNHVYALDASTGGLLWKHDTGDWVQYSPVVSEGVVYFKGLADGDQKLHALDAMSGELLWVSEEPYPYIDGFALAVYGKVYMPGESGEFHALDAGTGETVWSFSVGSGAESSPIADDTGWVFLTAVNSAYGLNAKTGEEIWSYSTETFPARDFPAVEQYGYFYFSPSKVLYALNGATGEPVWSYKASDFINMKPVVAEGMVYTGSEDGLFYALNAANGELVWSLEAMDWQLASPTVVDGVLYAESSDGYLRALDAGGTGEELWRFQKGYFSGVQSYTVAGGVVYVGSLDGSVYAFTAPVIR